MSVPRPFRRTRLGLGPARLPGPTEGDRVCAREAKVDASVWETNLSVHRRTFFAVILYDVCLLRTLLFARKHKPQRPTSTESIPTPYGKSHC